MILIEMSTLGAFLALKASYKHYLGPVKTNNGSLNETFGSLGFN